VSEMVAPATGVAMVADREAPARYRFGPLERRGLIAGWRSGQLATVAAGLLVAVGVLRVMPTVPGVLVAVLAVGAAAAAATVPLAGRTAEQWAPDALRHGVRHVARWQAARRPGPFASLHVAAVTTGDGRDEAGVVIDLMAGTYTAVIEACAPGFVLLGHHDRDRRVADWAAVLASLAAEAGAAHRLQWVERAFPDGAGSLRRYVARHRVAGAGTAVGDSYDELLALAGLSSLRHETLLALTVSARRAGRAVRAGGGGHAGGCAVVLRQVAALRRRLADIGITTSAPLGPAAVAAAMRRATLPAAEAALASASARWPWPMAYDAGWAQLRADATWHAVYWVAEWPRTEVGADFLCPLLLLPDVRRTVAVVMEPIAPAVAARQVEQARTADLADAELRRRGGFLATARRRREEEVLARREAELADGHAQIRFSGYVAVTADTPEALADACGRVEQAAAHAGLELRRCFGDQLEAFACSLPLGRGLG